jgi:hypothetical protein
MKNRGQIPFSSLSFEEWQNLAILAVLVFYLVLIGRVVIMNRPICEIEVVAGDYCAFWSAGKVANDFGYSKVYDLERLAQFQKASLSISSDNNLPFQVLPSPYLPIFITPFQLLSYLDVTTGFWVWTLINLTAIILYSRFFYREISGKEMPVRLTILLTISFQVFFNLYVGQLNIWLAIFAGEFLRLSLSGKTFRAGIWLGGLLLKPQLLILIIPIIFLRRWKSIFMGFCLSLFFILLVSFGLAQKEGLFCLYTLLLGHAQSVTPTGTEIMMNWRMMGLDISYLFNPIVGLSVAIIGSIITAISIIYIWKKSVILNPETFTICVFATFAATGALTWHAHLAMSLVMIPPLIYLYASKKLSEQIISWWVFMPTSVWFVRYIVGALIALQIIPFAVIRSMDFLYGLSGLALNLLFVFWALIKVRKLSLNSAKMIPSPIKKTIVIT